MNEKTINAIARALAIHEMALAAARQQDEYEKQMRELGHEPKTDFFGDFASVEMAAAFAGCNVCDEIRKEYDKVSSASIGDVKTYAELVITLNWRIAKHFRGAEEARREGNEDKAKFLDELSRCYNDLWIEADTKAWDVFKGEDAETYYRITD